MPAPSLLLHFDGADGSTTFTDSSPNKLNITPAGGAAITYLNSRFGPGAVSFNGSSKWLTIQQTNLSPGTGNFTIDFWCNTTSFPSSVGVIYSSGLSGGIDVCITNTGRVQIIKSGVGAILTSTSGVSINAWSHVAVTRESGTIRIFINGTQVYSGSDYTNYTSTGNACVGSEDAYPSVSYNGFVDELRVIIGEAAWTAAFTPPTSEYKYYDHIGYASISDGSEAVSLIGQVGRVSSSSLIDDGSEIISANGVIFIGSEISGDLPSITGNVFSYNAGDIVSGDLPSLIGYAYAGDYIDAILPSLTGSATAYTHAMAYIDGSLPMLVFDGQIMSTEILSANSTLPTITGYAYTGDTIIGDLPSLIGDSSTQQGSTSVIDGLLPFLIGDAQAVGIATLRAAAMLPMLISGSDSESKAVLPMLVGFGVIEGQETAVYEAYSINLKHNAEPFVNEVSHYPDYAGFEQIVRFENDYFARTPTGLFKIGGDTDNNKNINSSIETGYEDLGTRNYKTIKSIYVGGKMDPGFNVSVIASEDANKPKVYDNQTSRDKLPRNNRVIPGRNIRSSYIAYGITNNYGGKLDIDRVELEVFISNQRSL
jgi:hypothetical protein